MGHLENGSGRTRITADYIYAHDSVYNYLVLYFLLELSNPLFRQDVAKEISENERLAYCRHMAAWLPYEPHYDKILQTILKKEGNVA